MIKPAVFYKYLKRAGVSLCTGVPDSLLKDFCAFLDESLTENEHIITANEGNAIALASGFHLATGKIAAVYMQNSGLGNAINPLTSITDAQVYKIPLILIIGWRGETGIKDEPQHIKQGEITQQQLDLLDIPYWVLDSESKLDTVFSAAIQLLEEKNTPIALLIRKNTFSKYKVRQPPHVLSQMLRENALRCLLNLTGKALIVSTTGKTSREIFELRCERGENQRDFMTVGGMGHTSSIALGVALGNPKKQVVCIDGDGSLLMHFGALPIIGDLAPANLTHIVLNNAAHESVGNQPTVAGKLDFKAIALGCGYKDYKVASNESEICTAWKEIQIQPGPIFLEIKISTGSRNNLGRPTNTPQENKQTFMKAAIS